VLYALFSYLFILTPATFFSGFAPGRAAVGRIEKNVDAGPAATAIDSRREKNEKRRRIHAWCLV
jgi:hypothetical protein